HDQEEALTMSDRIAVMNHGRVEQVSPPVEVYERPTTTFVAGFIGVSNLMPATVVESGTVELDSGPRIDAPTDGFDSGERCHAVVRPEKLTIETIGANGAGGDGGLPPASGERGTRHKRGVAD